MNSVLQLAFDIGHSSIGWAVLETRIDKDPALLGCGSVIFPADDCLASTRRGFRRQRRHIRATRLRIARMKRLFSHLGVLADEQLDAPGCAWPWLLAARVLRGGKLLSWAELWDVLRWYAHNRGYDGNKAWSRHEAAASDEDTEKEQRAHELLDTFAKKHGRKGTMAEVFCDRLGIDPLGDIKASPVRFRDLGAAFPREGVEAEVERILRVQGVEENVITALMRDHTALAGPEYRLPARYGQRVNGKRTPGGLLFGQLVPRFENRIIATCPIMFQRVYSVVFDETGDAARAKHEAEKRAKVPGIGCVEFMRFRWAMQLANVMIGFSGRDTRRLSVAERQAVNAEMEKQGALTPGEFKKVVRALTGTTKDNLDALLAQDHSGNSLILDPALKEMRSGVLGIIWSQLSDQQRKHILTDLRRGKAITIRGLLAQCPAAQPMFNHWWDGEAMKTPKGKNKTPRTRDSVLDEKHSLPPTNGRAAYSREVMGEVWRFVMATDKHPMDEGAPLYRTEAIRHAQLQRAIDEQTNNHLVRHRLRLLDRLHTDILKQYAGGDKTRIERITVEVNRNVKELSGKTAQEQAKEQGQQTAQFRSVEKKLTAAYEGKGVRLTPGLVRKGRIAEDLAWACPYTGKPFDELDLLHRRVDKDHIIPRSQRASDSLDSLVVTYSEINKWKGNRTAVQFVEEEQGKTVPGLANVMIKPLNVFLRDVDGLDTFKGHDDDKRRKKNRQRLLKLKDYVEKEFTPGDLTKTSQLVRLAAEALQRSYLGIDQPPVVTSLPGSVTGTVRKSWNLIGCLTQANANVLNPDDLDQDGKPRVHRKTEIRGITHLHHALDASVLAFTSHFLPRDGGTWKKEVLELLSKRRCNPTEQAILRAMLRTHIDFTPEGQPILRELSKGLRQQLCERLAERRVVQHLPAEWGGLPTKETIWRVFDPADRHRNAQRLLRWLKEAAVEIPEPSSSKVILTMRKRRGSKDDEGGATGKVFHDPKQTWIWVYCEVERSKVLGLGIIGDKKLREIKGGKLISDNFGMALFPNAPRGTPKFQPIRHFRVWDEMDRLRRENGGKRPPILRRGQIIRFNTGPYAGQTWRVLGLEDNGKVRFFPPDTVRRIDKPENYKRLQIGGLLGYGLEILPSTLCGVASTMPSKT